MGFVVYGRIDKMATQIYNKDKVFLLDGTEIEIMPLKIKFLRDFMYQFNVIKYVTNDDEAILVLSECARTCMKQYYPDISHDPLIFQDSVDLPTIYKIIDVAAGIKIKKDSGDAVKDQAEKSGSSWDDLDLAKLESEVFLLGIWKDYEELERSLSIPELMATLSISRELSYEEKKFVAAINGVDLEAGKSRGQKEWEDLKAKVFSKGQTSDSKDILALQGQNAKKAGFGIGMGLEYDDLRN